MGDLLYLAFLFGVWLSAIAIIVCASVRREAGGQHTPRVLALRLRTAVVGISLVAAYLSVALPALLVPAAYSIIVAAFAVAMGIQGAHFGLSMVRARRLARNSPAPAAT